MLKEYIVTYQMTDPGQTFYGYILKESVVGSNLRDALERWENRCSTEYEIFSIEVRSTYIERD